MRNRDRSSPTHEAWLEQARLYQVDARLLRGAAIDAVVPGAAPAFVGALHTPTRRPGGAVAGRAGDRRGGAAARRDDPDRLRRARRRDQAGRVVGVVTEKGRIACDAVVLAGGAWSRLFCGNAGIDLPQLKVLGSVMRTEPLDGGPEIAAGGVGLRVPQAAGRRLHDGPAQRQRRRDHAGLVSACCATSCPRCATGLGEMCGCASAGVSSRNGAPSGAGRWTRPTPFEAVRVLDPAPRTRSWTRRARCCRALSRPSRRCRWRRAGADDRRDAGCGAGDLAGRVASGLLHRHGFSGHGFGIGPGAGRLMADLVTGDPPVVDPTPFRLGRFGG